MTPDTSAETPAGSPRQSRLAAFLSSPPPWVAKPVRVVTAIELGIAVTALLLIFFLILVQVGQRYLPVDGWAWTGELARFSLVWLTFVTAGVLVTTDSHITIEMVDGVRSPMVRRVVRVVSCLIVAAIGFGLMAEAWALVMDQGVLKSPAMRMPMSWLYGVSMVGFVSTTVRALVAALRYAVLGVPETSYDDVVGVPTS